MGAIEDTRKVLQDFLAPEMRELKTRIDALEKRMDERFSQVEKTMSERFDTAERRAELRHEMLLSSINHLANYNEMRERVAKIESSLEAVHQ
jgi:tetrahydromethanopterin S-methyltransferase subunit G